jgi:hypothetical protein
VAVVAAVAAVVAGRESDRWPPSLPTSQGLGCTTHTGWPRPQGVCPQALPEQRGGAEQGWCRPMLLSKCTQTKERGSCV